MRGRTRYAGLIVAAGLFLATMCGGAEAPVPVTAWIKSLGEEASMCEKKATLARDMAFNALENALAAEDEVRKNLVVVLKQGKDHDIRCAKKLLVVALKQTEEAVELTEKLMRHVRESLRESTMARDAAQEAARTGEAPGKKAAAQVADRVATARKTAERALSLADVLKEKWLVPAMSSVTDDPGRSASGGS